MSTTPTPSSQIDTTIPHISFWAAFRFWLKLGFISFGGPAGQISIMHQELVEQHHWISERRFLHALNFCMLLPGPEAQQLATYIGWLMHKTWGGIIAGVFFVLPSLFILIGLSWVYLTFGETTIMSGLFYGIKPAITAIVLQAAYRIGSKALKNGYLWTITAAAFIALFAFNVPFPLIIASAALCGYVGGKLTPEHFKIGSTLKKNEPSLRKVMIDDHTATPDHAFFSWKRLTGIACVGAILWFLPMSILMLTQGWNGTLTQMGWFFTKAAFLTFGGAYAVLPYVMQGAVTQYGWLTTSQMMDGLALGETTPGPLIMVVAFVGFVGGYVQAVCGPDMLFAGGALAAILVTWFTFLPSFLFIFAGAPLIESTHNDLNITAPLTAITAAVVGVILNLALFFAYHVLWPDGWSGQFDVVSAVFTLIAILFLFYFKRKMTHVLIGCALLGLCWRFYVRFYVQ